MRRILTVAVAALALLWCAGEVLAKWIYIPLPELVKDSDAIVVGKVVEVKDDAGVSIAVIEVEKVVRGDGLGKTVTLVLWPERGGARPQNVVYEESEGGSAAYAKGADGVWLLKTCKLRRGSFEADYPLRRQPRSAQKVIEILASGRTDAGEEILAILKDGDWQARAIALESVCGPEAAKRALPQLEEWLGDSKEPRDGAKQLARSKIPAVLTRLADADAGSREKALEALISVLERPATSGEAGLRCEAFNAATAIAVKHFGFKAAIERCSSPQAFDPGFAGPGGGGVIALAFRQERTKALIQVESLKEWWAMRTGKTPALRNEEKVF